MGKIGLPIFFYPLKKMQLSNIGLASVALLVATSFVLLLCNFFEPTWETNDDVAMSMVAHGYGIAAESSPNLVFSNVVWGYMVLAIPESFGILGYSVATFAVLVVVGAVIIYVLYQLGAGLVGAVLVMALILVRPLLFPQFTVNAGLLMLVAIMCWHLYLQQNDQRVLWLGCLLAYMSYLVRSHECLLVLMVAVPLLSWRQLWLRSLARVAFLVMMLAITMSAIMDYQVYQEAQWDNYRSTAPVRAMIDFGKLELLGDHPDLMERYGYSVNDINLLKKWFVVDPHILQVETLQNMLNELGALPEKKHALTNAFLGVETFFHPTLLMSVLAAALSAMLRPGWRVISCWCLCFLAIFLLGFLGRPGVLRIYLPLVSLLLIAPFMAGRVTAYGRWIPVIIFGACFISMSDVLFEAKTSQTVKEKIRQDLTGFPHDTVIAWAEAFPFEAVYPVFMSTTSIVPYRFYGLGGFTHAPFSVAYADQQSGRGMLGQLVEDKGVFIVAKADVYKFLDVYCKEHFQGKLHEISSRQYGFIMVSQRQCVTSKEKNYYE